MYERGACSHGGVGSCLALSHTPCPSLHTASSDTTTRYKCSFTYQTVFRSDCPTIIAPTLVTRWTCAVSELGRLPCLGPVRSISGASQRDFQRHSASPNDFTAYSSLLVYIIKSEKLIIRVPSRHLLSCLVASSFVSFCLLNLLRRRSRWGCISFITTTSSDV